MKDDISSGVAVFLLKCLKSFYFRDLLTVVQKMWCVLVPLYQTERFQKQNKIKDHGVV